MTSIEICEEIKQHWDVFLENHERFNEKQVKAAGVRARRGLRLLKTKSADLVKQTISEEKSRKEEV